MTEELTRVHRTPNKTYEDFLAAMPSADQLRNYRAELRHARLKGFVVGFWCALLILWTVLG
jgi:hypothetical protein